MVRIFFWGRGRRERREERGEREKTNRWVNGWINWWAVSMDVMDRSGWMDGTATAFKTALKTHLFKSYLC